MGCHHGRFVLNFVLVDTLFHLHLEKETNNFFNNMLQFILMVAASSVGEELFYRAAIQVRLGEVLFNLSV